jgi:hypothetical protein
MSWFGGGSRNTEPIEPSYGSTDDFSSSALSSGGMGGNSSSSLSEFQDFSLGLQQQLLIHTAITDMADKAFLKCITSCKDSKLSGKEVACIAAVTNKWLDTNEYMAGRLTRKSQAASQGPAFG